MISDTPDYDPRFKQAQSVEGAKARYVEESGYSLQDLENDLDELLSI